MAFSFEKKQDKDSSSATKQSAQRSSVSAQSATSHILRLQQTAGNRAVSALLNHEQDSPGSASSPQSAHTLQGTPVPGSEGHPLQSDVRALFEQRFGQDFSQLRVHTGGAAAEAARSFNAVAYTVGNNIVFDAGKFHPESKSGQHLLAHELAHVVQQSRGGGAAPSFDSSSGLEHGAARAAAQFSSGSALSMEGGCSCGGTCASCSTNGGAAVSVAGASAVGVARQSPGDKPAPRQPTVTAGIQQRMIEELDHARMETPFVKQRAGKPPVMIDPRSVEGIPFHGIRTVAVAAIIKPNGTVSYHSAAFDKGTPHAEPQLLERIASLIQPGDTVALAVDQEPCTKCVPVITEFLADPAHGSLRTYTLRAVRRDAPPGTTVQSGSPEQLTSSKTALQRDIAERGLREDPELRRVRLPLYREPGTAGGKPPSSPPAAKLPTAPSPEAPTGGGLKFEPRAGRAPVSLPAKLGQGIRGMVGGMFSPQNIALMALEWANRYSMAQAEAERASKLIGARVNSADVQARIVDMIEKDRLNIARKQHRGGKVYVTISMRLHFTNDVLDSLSLSRIEFTDTDKTSIVRTVMSHGAILGDEGSVWYVDLSVPVGEVQVSTSESIKLRLEELEDIAREPSSQQPETVARLSEERNRLLEEQTVALREEERAREAEIRQPTVLNDPKRRAEQQQELLERARRRAAQRQVDAPPKQAQAPDLPTGPQALIPPTPTAPIEFLPFRPTVQTFNPEPSQVIAGLEMWGKALVAEGSALVRRLGPDGPRLDQEKEVLPFLAKEQEWREAVKRKMNDYTKDGPSSAVQGLKDLFLDPEKPGPKLERMRTQVQ